MLLVGHLYTFKSSEYTVYAQKQNTVDNWSGMGFLYLFLFFGGKSRMV